MGPKEALKEGPGPSGDPKRRCRLPPGHNFPHVWYRLLLFFNTINDLFSTCNCRLNRPRRITKPMKIMHLSTKTTTGDGPSGEIDCRRPRPRPTTTGDDHGRRATWWKRPRPRPTTTTTGDGPLKRLSTNGIRKNTIDKSLKKHH